MSSRRFPVDQDAIEEVSVRLDLREPNRAALETTAFTVFQHFEDGGAAPLEAVLDSATGVGKTFIMLGVLEYFAQVHGIRHFAVIAQGRTILNKTIANLTPGHPKSLVDSMAAPPVVVTADNFNTPAMRAEMLDDSRVKVYVFTVQALIKPTTKAGRRTHAFQEGLGSGLYEHLQGCEDLVVFADEHHCYYGNAFSNAVRDLTPTVLLGLTATPHKKTPEEEIIFRYPLAAAIAQEFVKTPVVVGRTDDREDPETKIRDGVSLLEYKAEAVATYCERTGAAPVNPVMLIIAQTIDDAEEYGKVVRSSDFFGGRYADSVLVVHSDAADEALEALDQVEDPNSGVRIIISVGMLKEGWDVKNVYVIASMRSSISDVLTEQTLGRGLRLPFGSYTGIEILDTLEVVAHERYEQLLKKAGVINEAFVDHRTRAVLKENAKGELVAVTQKEEDSIAVVPEPDPGSGPAPALTLDGGPAVATVEARTGAAKESALRMQTEVAPRDGVEPIEVPRLRMSKIQSEFSLGDITDTRPFKELGEKLSADPEDTLRRMVVSAKIVEGADGLKRTELVTTTAADRVATQVQLLPLEDLRAHLRDATLTAPIVPARKEQKGLVEPLLDAFLQGMGEKAAEVLTGYLDRATARFLRLVADEQRKHAPKPRYEEVVEVERLGAVRTNARDVSSDLIGRFSKRTAYEGWQKSLYAIEWFDSSTERSFARVVDAAPGVDRWVRLHQGELPILWSAERSYHADFVVVETDGTCWVVEVKSDKDAPSDEVQAKRKAAKRWANHVNASERVSAKWRYLLVTETDIQEAKDSWEALKGLGS